MTLTIGPELQVEPALRAALKRLQLTARRSAASQGLGQHASRSRGAGLEFAQYRAYEPGDELRQIDWKLYGRSDRFFVREAERDSPLTLWLLVDASASMAFADAGFPARSKWAAAKLLCACLIELAQAEGDKVGLLLLGDHRPLLIPAASGLRQRDRLLLALATQTASGTLPLLPALQGSLEKIPAEALVVMLGDGFDAGWALLAERLSAARREVRHIQILGADERDFPYQGAYLFREPESGDERRVEAAAARDEFLRAFSAARHALQRRFQAANIAHVEFFLDESPLRPLQALFRGAGARR